MTHSERRAWPLLAGVVLALVLTPADAEACTCAMGKPACETLFTSGAVFLGRVDSITPVPGKDGRSAFPPRRRVRLTVIEAFTGVTEPEVEVETGAGGGDCGYRFQQGAVYFVDATRITSGRLGVSICSLTRLASTAGDDIAFARAAFVNNVPLGRVGGTLTFVERNYAGRPERRTPAADVPVIIQRHGARWTATTDPAGRFAVDGLAPGRYSVRFEVAEGQYATLLWADPELRDPRGCADASAIVAYDGRIAGRVLDAAGRPMPGLTLNLTGRVTERYPNQQTLTRDDGSFEFVHLPAGTFVVGIHTDQPDQAASPLPIVFYPGATTVERATRIRLKGGERSELAPLVLPESVRPVVLGGLVLDAGGAPAPGVRVFAKGAGDAAFITGLPVETDALGRFRITGFEGVGLKLFAEATRRGGGPDLMSDQIPVSPTSGMPPVTLKLKVRY